MELPALGDAAIRLRELPPAVAAADGMWTFTWDGRVQWLEPSDTVTMCPYKGTARYWSVRAGGQLHRDLAWSYPDPIPENPRIADLICVFNERVDLTVDGELQGRPDTPWS